MYPTVLPLSLCQIRKARVQGIQGIIVKRRGIRGNFHKPGQDIIPHLIGMHQGPY